MKQRQSTRVAVLSKSMRVVDEDTRTEFHHLRLLALEVDNYQEQQGSTAAKDEEAFTLSDDDGPAKKKKAKQSSSQSKSKASVKNKWISRPVKSLERILLDNGISPDDTADPDIMSTSEDNDKESSGGGGSTAAVHYYNIAARPSAYPARSRHFCSVCGYLANYSCVRCGSRYCSIKCNTNHAETRCMKFSI